MSAFLADPLSQVIPINHIHPNWWLYLFECIPGHGFVALDIDHQIDLETAPRSVVGSYLVSQPYASFDHQPSGFARVMVSLAVYDTAAVHPCPRDLFNSLGI